MELLAHIVTSRASGLANPEIIILTDVDPDNPEAQEIERFPLGDDGPIVTLERHGYKVGPRVTEAVYAVTKRPQDPVTGDV